MKALGHVFKYGDNVDTDVIIPARYLNSYDAQELASHAMADIDPEFVNKVQPGDIIVANKNFECDCCTMEQFHVISIIYFYERRNFFCVKFAVICFINTVFQFLFCKICQELLHYEICDLLICLSFQI